MMVQVDPCLCLRRPELPVPAEYQTLSRMGASHPLKFSTSDHHPHVGMCGRWGGSLPEPQVTVASWEADLPPQSSLFFCF